MELTLNWLAEVWQTFSAWTSTQPTFVQVAFGVGLFYAMLQLLRLSYRLSVYTIKGLFTGRDQTRKKKDFKPPNRSKKHVTLDDDTPPFVFR